MLTTMNAIPHGRGEVYVWAKCSICGKGGVVQVRPKQIMASDGSGPLGQANYDVADLITRRDCSVSLICEVCKRERVPKEVS